MIKNNKVFIVGELVEVNTQIRTSQTGKEYISGKVVVKCGENNLVEVKVYAFAKTSGGTDSKMFATYSSLERYLHQRVQLTCELRDGSMVAQEGVVRHFNEIYLKFINPARSDMDDSATFEFAGFVVKEIYERTNRDGELIGYRFEVAQANYNDTNMNVIRFDVDKNDLGIVEAIQSSYAVGSTIEINGTITYLTTVETKTEQVAFGEPVVKTFAKSEKSFRVTGGKEPIDPDSPDAYTETAIRTLINAYKEADAATLARSKTSEEPAPEAPKSGLAGMTRRSSLI